GGGATPSGAVCGSTGGASRGGGACGRRRSMPSCAAALVMSASASMAAALEARADIARVGVEERRHRAARVAQLPAPAGYLVRAHRRRRIAHPAREERRGVREADEADHVVLVDAVAGHA